MHSSPSGTLDGDENGPAPMPEKLHDHLDAVVADDSRDIKALSARLESLPATDRRDRFLTLLAIYDLHLLPLDALGPQVRWAGHPSIATVKTRLEQEWLAELNAATASLSDSNGHEPVAAIRALAARQRLPQIYKRVAEHATLEQLRQFLAVEGGPDGGFDDLVALCQVGLSGTPKLELARNYWDEMGNGRIADVHTDLHRTMTQSVNVPAVARGVLPEAALERSALGGLLATNRWLQPEMIGALGLTELQAGPRCRLVLQAFTRLELPAAARTFYEVHADVDPRHGKDWLDNVIEPLSVQMPQWRHRMVRGAAWRWQVNAALFDTLDLEAELTSTAA